MYNGKQAYDIDTGRLLTDEEATTAADNPAIYRWVGWVNNNNNNTDTRRAT